MTALNSIKINSIEIIDYVWKKSLKVAFDCSGIKKMDISMLFLVQYHELELDYSGGIFLWFRAGILRNRIKEENLYILQ